MRRQGIDASTSLDTYLMSGNGQSKNESGLFDSTSSAKTKSRQRHKNDNENKMLLLFILLCLCRKHCKALVKRNACGIAGGLVYVQ